MSEQPTGGFTRTAQAISVRLLAECRKTYGATVDDQTLQSWVTTTLGALLTEQTRVTQFVQVLAMREIREFANQYVAEAA